MPCRTWRRANATRIPSSQATHQRNGLRRQRGSSYAARCKDKSGSRRNGFWFFQLPERPTLRRRALPAVRNERSCRGSRLPPRAVRHGPIARASTSSETPHRCDGRLQIDRPPEDASVASRHVPCDPTRCCSAMSVGSMMSSVRPTVVNQCCRLPSASRGELASQQLRRRADWPSPYETAVNRDLPGFRRISPIRRVASLRSWVWPKDNPASRTRPDREGRRVHRPFRSLRKPDRRRGLSAC